MDQLDKQAILLPFSTFVFRTPLISLQEFEENIKRLEGDENYWYEFLNNKSLQEAIFLGTPILYDEIQKFLSGMLTAPKEVSKLKLSVLRYYTRMSTRCTPFGLFAGFSLGKLGNTSEIELVDSNQYRRYTRLDMNYLCNLSHDISKLPEVRRHLKYYPNNSLYPLGDKLRYVEYYFRNTKSVHNITAIENSEYLEKILSRACTGCKIEDLTDLLVNGEIMFEEVTDFINELIDNRILISELEPVITGKDFLIHISTVLQTIPEIEDKKEICTRISSLLSEMDDREIGKTLPLYAAVEEAVKQLNTMYEAKYLFQVDMFKPINKAVLDKKIIQNIQEALELMNILTLPPTETLLSKFAENYCEQYEDKEMPLLQVLDSENGIGYQQNTGDISPLLAGYILPIQQPYQINIKWNQIQSVLHKKFMEAYKSNAYTVEIEAKDFDFLKMNGNDLPPSISCMCEIFSTDETNTMIYVHNSGGSSAANLLGRFCYINPELENYVKEITALEQSHNLDALYAEIIHLPESRIGNILLRPVLRPYEIPYLGKSSVEDKFQIPLSDLYVSVKGRKVLLRSKRLNKEIIPKLSSAHNYSFNSMPVYHFLCDMQIQGLRGGINFYWGSLANEYEFLPRVKYKNVLLSLAKWTIRTEDFKKLLGFIKENEKSTNDRIDVINKEQIEMLKKWRQEKQLPQYVVLPDGDNELFVDMDNSLSLQTLYSTIKKRSIFQLEEFPFDKEKSLVKNNLGQTFTNEFVFGFYKNHNEYE